MINADRLVETFCELAAIDSPSGEEGKVAEYISNVLTSIEYDVGWDAFGNLIASNGISGDTRQADILILSAHMDTVEPGRGVIPVIEGDQIMSAGDTVLGGDCKAGVAAILEGVRAVSASGREHRPVELVFTREEEIGLVGAKNLDYDMIRGKQAVVFDGEGPPNVLTDASPTYFRFDIRSPPMVQHEYSQKNSITRLTSIIRKNKNYLTYFSSYNSSRNFILSPIICLKSFALSRGSSMV